MKLKKWKAWKCFDDPLIDVGDDPKIRAGGWCYLIEQQKY